MNNTDLDYNEDDAPEGSFFKRNWLALTVGVIVLAGGTSAAIALSSKGGGGKRPTDNFTMVSITPPPPVMLPPPPPPPQVEEMMKAEDEKEEAPVEDNAPSTGIVSDKPADAYGLKAGKGGKGPGIFLTPKSPVVVWTKYANQAASRIADSMRRHGKLKQSNLSIEAKVWIDSTGRITRAETQSTGDALLDGALRNDVLSGMQLSGPPPEGMKMPVNLKLSARRPG